jgi:glycosyltransferase involved in cell wall biosynthesis
MIRFITKNTEGITPDRLPPEKPDGRLRLLIVTMKYTGLRSIGLEFEKFCAQRDDVDAVSVLFDPPLWLKVLCHPLPTEVVYDYSAERMLAGWRWYIRRWFDRALPLERFDAVHCTQQLVSMGVLDQRRPGAWPVVCPNLDATAWNVIDEWGDSERWNRPMIAAERRIFAESEVIASTSEWASESLVRRYGVGREKIVWAPPTSEVLPRPDLEPGVPLPDRKPRILFIGNNWVRKGGQRLLEIHQKHFKDRAELHAVSRERPADTPPLPGVVWHGQVPRDRLVNEIVPSCDLFCMPSQRDTSCWPAVEAQGAGLPVVVPRMTGIPDLVEHGKTGFVVDTTDDREYIEAIETLISDRERCRAMGRAGQDLVRRQFTRDVVFGRIVEAMKQARARVGRG